ncbi:hypothetical protein FCM35_KLT18605 [Carex littledalei]|uniref:Uncharacterized protein n=1 Tax=Carex littledalei TaxID=544730 RepID=A0A833RM52_9POAL|nr:hypothetical protein FCM35_KLT18605 [Carex littledalei]
MKQQLPKHTNKDDPNLEILKAAAQAWLAHSSNPKSSTKEFDMRKGTSMRRPSRFQLEAIKLSKQRERETESGWDFSRSLWDPYEIVAVSKRLELGLLLDHAAAPVPFVSRAEPGWTSKRGRKGSNGLRKLLRRSFPRRLNSG